MREFDYQPDEFSVVSVEENISGKLIGKDEISILTWNIGYGSLGSSEDFFLDGGSKVRPDDKLVVTDNLERITKVIKEADVDFVMLQELDRDSKRSYYIDQYETLSGELNGYSKSFSKNYDVDFVPIPFPPTGKIVAGLGSYTKYEVSSASRIALPGEYSWPQKVIMLDRCMMVSRLPVDGSENELVMINAHFSAYDDGSIREKQLSAIKEFVETEYDKGNYIVLGGDWNQTFYMVDTERFPTYNEGEIWLPNIIPDSWFDAGWTYGVDAELPTYRLLNEPYIKGTTQTGIIDGFLVSPNVSVIETKTYDLGFELSDHNPIVMKIKIK